MKTMGTSPAPGECFEIDEKHSSAKDLFESVQVINCKGIHRCLSEDKIDLKEHHFPKDMPLDKVEVCYPFWR